MGMFSRDPIDPPLRCSFCNKNDAEVKKIIAGPEVFICDECVSVCSDIVAAQQDTPVATEPPPVTAEASTTVVTCGLCRMRLPWEEAVTVPERGALCPGCVSAIEAALAEWHEDRA